MSSSRALLRPGACLTVLILALVLSSAAQAGQLLTNGSFEQGATAWTGNGFATGNGCPAFDGAAAASLSTSADLQTALVRQDISPISVGSYTLSGQARMLSGSASMTVTLYWLDAGGNLITKTIKSFNPGTSYGSFSLVESSSPADARTVMVRIMSSGADSVACLDALSLDGPAYVAPTTTNTPTATAVVSATSIVQLTATPTPTVAATQSASPTRTATTPPSATTDTASSSAGPSSLSFSNGGFESGLAGWQKFGGELRAVSSPHRSGSSAGALTSTTDSTKWAYQAVAIDASSAYSFSGYIRGEGSLSAAYLRISWYASGDGSGQAIATDDFTGQVNAAGADFVYLSTGAVSPPQGTHSARLRVVMAPSSSASTTVYMDDFDFGQAALSPQATPRVEPTLAPSNSAQGVEPPPPTVVPSGTTPAAAASTATPQTAGAGIATTVSPSSSPAVTPSPVSEVEAAARLQPTRSTAPASASDESAAKRPSGGGGLPIWPVAVLLGIVGAGGAYMYARNKQT